VHAREEIGNPALPPGAGLGFEPVDQIDDIEEAAARAAADAGTGDRDGEMRLADPGRSRDILPGIRTLKAESSTGSIRATARWRRSPGGIDRVMSTS
jgi:hypothetical protein